MAVSDVFIANFSSYIRAIWVWLLGLAQITAVWEEDKWIWETLDIFRFQLVWNSIGNMIENIKCMTLSPIDTGWHVTAARPKVSGSGKLLSVWK